VYFLAPFVFYLLIYPILRSVHDARRASGDKSISGLELLFWLSIGVLVVVVIALMLGF